jgi:tetratricopeptide (TPR) repeat protein
VSRLPEHRVRIARRIAVGVLVAFAAFGVARLNPFCLLEPDSSDYLFTSRSLVTLFEYRDIDQPERPLHTFRPPGLPLMLAPLSLARPYDVVAAKLMILATTLVMLALLYLFAERIGCAAGGLAALALVAASPYTLLHGTEVMTEAPYIACTLGILLLVLRGEPRPTRRVTLATTSLLVFLPFLRTIGVVLIAAVALWGLSRRSRLRWSAIGAVALLPAILWSWRNHVVGGPTYVSNVVIDLSALGPVGFFKKAAAELWTYLERLIDVTLPGLSPGRPLYERVIVGGAPDLVGLGGLVLPLGLLVLVLAISGMVVRRDREGGLVAVYVALFLMALAVYPPKNERLAWPLVPLLWAYVPVGLQWVGGLVHRRAVRQWHAVTALALFAGVPFTVWQATLTWKTVQSNVRWYRESDRFYADAPPSYYADWRAAGRWLHDHAPTHARVLTRHSDLGLASRRSQESIRFEEISPVEWRREIARYGATYLAAPTTSFGKLFPREAIGGDPIYELEPVYRERDVMILEVRPNRSGTLRTDEPEVSQDLAACREALARDPARIDLVRRCAELTARSGRGDEAVGMLREAITRKDDARLRVTLGSILLGLGRHDEALASFERASELPRAVLLPRTIERGIRKAEEGIVRERDPRSPDRAASLAETALREMEILQIERALGRAREAVDLAPEDPSALYALGEVLRRLGRDDEAVALFDRAAEQGHPRAGKSSEIMRRTGELGRASEEATPEQYLSLAIDYARDGLPGVALDLLESGLERFPDSREIRARLADLYLFYGQPERSEPLFLDLVDADPGESRARAGAAASAARLDSPSF